MNFSLFKPKPPRVIEPVPRILSIAAAGEEVVSYLIVSSSPGWIELFEKAKSGAHGIYSQCLDIITQVLAEQKITVDGYAPADAAEEIFRYHYGLRELDKYYKDDRYDEIRVAPDGRVYVINQGKLEATDIQYTDEEVANIINRLRPVADVGVSLDEGNPMMELVRPDGFRLSALCKPVTSGYCFALRKHGNMIIDTPSFIKKQTIDEKVGQIFQLLAKGRRNILICGGVNSGKTTLLKLLAGMLDSRLSIRVLDNDNEVRLSELYPEREIWELEAHPEVGSDMKKLFTRTLRITPDVIIVPEFRGDGEVWTTIDACTRGHDGSMATAHFSSFASPDEAIRNTAMLAIQEGVTLPVNLVMERVAQAFGIIIQTYNDARTGIKKVTCVTELIVKDGAIIYSPLVSWETNGDNYITDGEWKILNPPSVKCCQSMQIYGVTQKEIDEVFEVVPGV